jgi:hypothetical protein
VATLAPAESTLLLPTWVTEGELSTANSCYNLSTNNHASPFCMSQAGPNDGFEWAYNGIYGLAKRGNVIDGEAEHT